MIYGKNIIGERKEMCIVLIIFEYSVNEFWVLCGEFNVVVCIDDRLYGNFIIDVELIDLKVFMNDLFFSNMKVL